MPTYEPQKFLSKEAMKILYSKLKEIQEMLGITLLKFTFTFPYFEGPGLPVDITMKVELRD